MAVKTDTREELGMGQRLAASEKNGGSIPPSRSKVNRRFNEEYGEWEKQCTDCGEWWPDDKEFFYTCSKNPIILMNQCKDCYTQRRRRAGTK